VGAIRTHPTSKAAPPGALSPHAADIAAAAPLWDLSHDLTGADLPGFPG
jgi:hypothetical protein